MNALVGDTERGARGHFQIVIRLQLVRAQVHDHLRRNKRSEIGRADMEEILTGIQGVALASREEGLTGFASVCLHICERLEPLLRSGPVARSMLVLIGEWAANAELYLRRPAHAEFARALVQQLTDPQWGSALEITERARLLHGMLEPFS